MGKNKVKASEKVLAYRFWPGFQTFLCQGRIMIPLSKNRPLTLLFIILLSQCFFLVSLCSQDQINSSLILISTLFFMLTVFFHLKLLTSDPGFIPRQTPPFAKGPIRAETYSTVSLREPSKEIALSKPYLQYPINGTIFNLKYCKCCLILRPPRTSHCNDCNVCVEQYDHHCPWLGICIGKKNYKLFFVFISTNTLYFSFNWACGLYSSIKFSDDFPDFVMSNWGFILFFVLSFLVTIIQICGFFFMLLGFHCFLLASQQTTREFMKKTWKNVGMNPFALKYWWQIFIFWRYKHTKIEHFGRFAEVSLNFEFCNINPSVLAVKPQYTEDTRGFERSFIEKSTSSLNLTTIMN